jgi:hypothetical protein
MICCCKQCTEPLDYMKGDEFLDKPEGYEVLKEGLLVTDYRNSRLYKDDRDGVLSILEKENVMFHNHYWCITEQVFTFT